MTKLLFDDSRIRSSGFHGASLQAQDAMPSSGTGMKDMKPQMEQLQALMKDAMDKMAAPDTAMKTHMETEQASMKSQMALHRL